MKILPGLFKMRDDLFLINQRLQQALPTFQERLTLKMFNS